MAGCRSGECGMLHSAEGLPSGQVRRIWGGWGASWTELPIRLAVLVAQRLTRGSTRAIDHGGLLTTSGKGRRGPATRQFSQSVIATGRWVPTALPCDATFSLPDKRQARPGRSSPMGADGRQERLDRRSDTSWM